MDQSKFKRIEVTSVRQQFEEELVNMIMSGQLRTGEQLPTERQLAADMGISKTMVHEGIRDLVRMGFLDNMTQRGVVVANYALTGNIETLITVLNYRQGIVDARTACGVIDFCESAECPSLEKIAAHHTKREIETLEKMVQATAEASLISARRMGENWAAYHRQIVFYSGNPLYPLLYSSMMQIGLPVFHAWCAYTGPDAILEDLHVLTDSVKLGDGAAAVKRFHSNANEFRDYIRAHKEIFRPDLWSLD